MTVWLTPDQVAERLGIHRKTAMAYMMEMHPVAISGTVKRRYRVSEENLDKWMLRRTVGGKPSGSSQATGSQQKMKRR